CCGPRSALPAGLDQKGKDKGRCHRVSWPHNDRPQAKGESSVRWRTLATVHQRLSEFPVEFISAATAAKLIGVKPGTIHALAEAELLPAIMVDYRLANRQIRLVRHADLEAFANEYIVLRALSGTRKATFEETQLFIADNGVSPLPLIGDTRKIFRRTDIERIAYLPGGERLARLLLVDEARLQALFAD
ncbi:MAG TPA: hypothetical protein VGC14_04740, partial [Rhizobium sp.]